MKILLLILIAVSIVTLTKVWSKPRGPEPLPLAKLTPTTFEDCQYFIIELKDHSVTMCHKGNCTNWQGHVGFYK